MEDKPKIMTTKAVGEWSAPMLITAKMGEFDVVLDEPAYVGGTNKGASPMDYVTAALIGCAGITLSVVAKQMDFSFTAARFEAEGDIDLRGFAGMPGVCRHFCDFRGKFYVKTNESQERLDMVKDQVENRCPVFNLLHDAGVQTSIEWIKE